jgi:flagellar hook-associated protein 1
MGSLTALLNLSQNALLASQQAVDITSNNVANANTPGYTDEIAVWTERDRVSLSGNASAGNGASVSVQSVRDPVLNQRVQQQTQAQAAASQVSTTLNQLQSVFGISASSTSAVSTTIGTDLSAFFGSLSSLQANPSDASVRSSVLNSAKTLATDFNTASSQIGQLSTGLNQQIPAIVGQVNSLTASIASLNLQIESTSPKGDAGTLEDQRQQDLTQLSQYIGFDQTKTENNGITLTTANGAPLVSSGVAYALSTGTSNGNATVLSAAGQDITAGITGGQLGGVIQARDHELQPYLSQLNQLAFTVGDAVNTQNQAGLDGNGNPGGWIFGIPGNAGNAAALITVGATDPNVVAAAAVGQGPTGSGNAAALSALGSQTQATLNDETPAGYFASFLTQVGGAASTAASESAVAQGSLTQLTTQQSSQSSVSLDQEASNLTLYQRSYEAASKVFTIVDQLMATALNLGEEATVS